MYHVFVKIHYRMNFIGVNLKISQYIRESQSRIETTTYVCKLQILHDITSMKDIGQEEMT